MVSEKAMAELRGLVEKWQKYVDAHDGQYAYIEGVKLCLRELEDALDKLSKENRDER